MLNLHTTFTFTVARPTKSLAISFHSEMLVNLLLSALKDIFAVLAFSVFLHLSCSKFTLKEQVVKHFCSAFKKILPLMLEMYKYSGACKSIYRAYTHT